MVKITILLFALLLLFPIISFPQSNPLKVKKITKEVVFDGVPDEPVWQTIEALPMTMLTPIAGDKPSEETIYRIAYNDEYFYVSGILNHSDISDLRAIGKKRDYATSATDFFGIVLDSYNDRKTGVSFWTNPNGIRTDGTVQNDAIGDTDDINFSWNTFWDVKTNINDQGWTAEFRIPFSSLRFQKHDGKTVMGIILTRFIAAKNEMSNFPALSPDYSLPFWKSSLSALIEFEGLNPKKTVYITPYITGGVGQENKLNNNNTAYNMDTNPKFDAGLDIKYSLTNNLTADLTINTDFAQVEADNQQINLTRFSLYFPEKRIFFLEKSDVFDFSFLGGNNLFYSRKIGLHEGNPVRIYGGLRMTGRIGEWDIGILDMQTAKFEENPSENFGVVRAKRTVFNQNSYVSGMATTRMGTDGSYNVAYGLDGLFRVTGDEYLTLKWGQTFENDSANKVFDLAPSRFLFEWQRRKETGFAYDFVYTWSGKSFNPGVGFEVKDNYHGSRVVLQHGWLPNSTSFIRYHKFSLSGWNFWNTATNLQETSIAVLAWEFEAKKGFGGNISINFYREDLMEELTLGNDQASVPADRYT
ncbi:MAG: carbohydrate binding family 9 domain-containing protein, partial [Mariniphaga sp.]|nr:carbohydrate binding family 9 domain-containing protein [Mariniphaga sp.]